MAYSKQQIIDYAHQLEANGAPSEDIDAFVKDASSQIQPDRTIAEKASNVVNTLTPSLKNITSPSALFTQPYQKGKEVLNAGIAADKNYPAENLLPAAGASLGGIIGGGAATIGSGGPGLPFGSTLGSGVGGQIGDVARQYVAAMRGNPGVSNTPQEAITGSLKTGAKMAAAELGGSSLMKTLTAIPGVISGAGEKGLKGFIDYFSKETTPVDKSITDALRAKYADAPVGDVSDTANTAKDILQKRGFNVSSPNDLPVSMSPAQIKNLQEGGLSTSDIQKLSKAGISDQSSDIKQIASGMKPKLVSDLQSLDPTDFKMLNNVYQDLGNPEKVASLTYGDLQNLKSEVGQYANFDATDQKRDALDKIYGKIYGKIKDLMSQTAEKNGFLKDHNFIQQEGYKYFQNRFLRNLQDTSMQYGENAPTQDFGKMVSKVQNLTPTQVKMIFGENSDKFNALRDFMSAHAKTFMKSGEPTGMINSMSGIPYVRARIPNPLRVTSTPDYIESILNRNMPGKADGSLGNISYSGLPGIQQTKKIGKGLYPFIIPSNENR